MGWTRRLCPRLGTLLVALGVVIFPCLAHTQAPAPAPSPPPAQAEPPTTGGFLGQPAGPSGPGAEAQPQPQAIYPGGPLSVGTGTKAQDPFQGSPLLQMFERSPEVIAPLRQLHFAPVPEEPFPFTVRLLLSAEEEFTDNVNQTQDNRKSEFRTRIVPGISVRADRPWVNLGLSYAPEVFIPRNSIGDTEINQNLSARALLWPTGRFQASLAEDYTDSHDFRDVQDPGSRQTGANNFKQNVATAEVAYLFPQLRTALAYTNIVNVDQQDVGGSDTRISHTVRPSAAYTDARINLSGSAGVTRGDLDSSVSTPYWRYDGDGLFLYVFTPALRAGLTGFYQYQEPDSGLHFTMGRGRATGIFDLGPSGTLEVAAGADTFTREDDAAKVRPSFLFAYTYRFVAFAVTARVEQGLQNRAENVDNTGATFTRSAGIFLTSSFFRDLTMTLGGRYEENTFLGTTVQSPTAGTKDRTWAVDAELRYLLVRSLFLTLAYDGTFRTSTQEGSGFNENRVRMGATYQYSLF